MKHLSCFVFVCHFVFFLFLSFLFFQLRSVVDVPMLFNGDVFSSCDADRFVSETAVEGVMSARGILSNPALFSGSLATPISCIIDYITFSLQYGGLFRIHHQHLIYMTANLLTKAERKEFAELRSMTAVIQFIEKRGWTKLYKAQISK